MAYDREKLTAWNSMRFCLAGLYSKGFADFRQRLAFCWDQHLHIWVGHRHRRVVEEYFSTTGVTPVGGLAVAISECNRRQLKYYSYAIRKLIHVPGIKSRVLELANVHRASEEEDSHAGEQKYHNLLVELHACCFVHKWLGMTNIDVEYPGHAVLSPNRVGSKSCDISGGSDGRTTFFECKDSSWEIMCKQRCHGMHVSRPKTAEGCRLWLLERMKMAADKGADYLIVKMPMWSEHSGRGRYIDWMRRSFPEARHTGGNRFMLPDIAGNYGCVKGAYVLNHGRGVEIMLGQ